MRRSAGFIHTGARFIVFFAVTVQVEDDPRFGRIFGNEFVCDRFARQEKLSDGIHLRFAFCRVRIGDPVFERRDDFHAVFRSFYNRYFNYGCYFARIRNRFKHFVSEPVDHVENIGIEYIF